MRSKIPNLDNIVSKCSSFYLLFWFFHSLHLLITSLTFAKESSVSVEQVSNGGLTYDQVQDSHRIECHSSDHSSTTRRKCDL
jgi:hypothetical protein